jgi:hypothetical protein
MSHLAELYYLSTWIDYKHSAHTELYLSYPEFMLKKKAALEIEQPLSSFEICFAVYLCARARAAAD